jgi:hypothetical protein
MPPITSQAALDRLTAELAANYEPDCGCAYWNAPHTVGLRAGGDGCVPVRARTFPPSLHTSPFTARALRVWIATAPASAPVTAGPSRSAVRAWRDSAPDPQGRGEEEACYAEVLAAVRRTDAAVPTGFVDLAATLVIETVAELDAQAEAATSVADAATLRDRARALAGMLPDLVTAALSDAATTVARSSDLGRRRLLAEIPRAVAARIAIQDRR